MRDFFERQSAARRNSFLLALYFLLAVVLVAGLVSVAIYVMFSFDPGRLNTSATPFNLNPRGWNYLTIGKIAGPVLFLIFCGSLYKYLQLRSGGGALIAEMLGGQVIYPDTEDFHERRLLNIIEEMAIASGVTVPSVYLLPDERGINAFAAGYAQEDAVLGVTWGALHYLNREELQGVIAHEFSHILSGDMLINIRLQGLLHGILVLGLLGGSILRGAFHSSGKSRGGAGAAGIGIGLVLYILGYAGVFVGRLIKSAISRQREFLADASAVQFTRNPLGLARALKKIGGLDDGSRIRSPRAAEISHMYFGNGMAESWFNAFSTHPPLLERIQRLDPEFQGTYPAQVEPVAVDREEALAYATEAISLAATSIPPEQPELRRAKTSGDAKIAGNDLRQAVDSPPPAQMRMARELIASLPAAVRNSARTGFGARAVIYGLLLDSRPEVRAQQLAALKKDADPRVWHEFSRLLPDVATIPPELRLPLADLAIPALKTLSLPQYKDFRQNIKTLMTSDGTIDLFEYALHAVLLKHLRSRFGTARKPLLLVNSLGQVRDEVSCVLSLLARYGQDDDPSAQKAMMRALRQFADRDQRYFAYLPEPQCSLKDFDQALRRLGATSMPIKQRLLAAALECIIWDSRITVREAELYRVITEVLDCPVPPWLSVAGVQQ